MNGTIKRETKAEELPFKIEAEIEWREGQPVFSKITIERIDNGPPITQTHLRKIPFQKMLRQLVKQSEFPSEYREILQRRTNRVSDNNLHGAREIYEKARYFGDLNPTKQVMDRFNISRQTARRWIRAGKTQGASDDS